MRVLRVLAACLGLWMLAAAQTSMSVDQLFTFLRSSVDFIKQGTMTDKQLADYLVKCKLTERLDDRSLEQMQALGVGPKTLEALRRLRDQSQTLAAAKPIELPPDPRLAPPPSSEEQGQIEDEVRNHALAYTESLPDFICAEVIKRFGAIRPGLRGGSRAGEEPSWQPLDTLTIRLTFFQKKEDYKLLMIDNAPTSKDYRAVGGEIVLGDFGTMMDQIFARSSEARFEWDHWGMLRSRLTMVFAYRVMEARSKWHVGYDNRLEVIPGYRGLVYVDKESHEVLRVTLSAESLPPDFPVKSADTILDYDYQDLSGQKFLLPLKARTDMADSETIMRNDEEFHVYRKYSAESQLTFDYPNPEPLPENQTKEAPPPAASPNSPKTKP